MKNGKYLKKRSNIFRARCAREKIIHIFGKFVSPLSLVYPPPPGCPPCHVVENPTAIVKSLISHWLYLAYC